MSDLVHRSLHALIAEHGDGLLARQDLCERLLREAAPGQDEEVRVVAMALADGVPARLSPWFDAAAVERETEALAQRHGIPAEEARRAVEVWAEALRTAPNSAAGPAPSVPLDDLAPAARAAPEPGAISLTQVWLGVRSGGGAGLLTGFAVALLCAGAMLLAGGDAKPLPVDFVTWMVLSVVAGGAVGTVAVALRLTGRPELLGGMAGAAAGLLGGLLYAPVAAAMPGCADTVVRQASGTAVGVCVSVIAGGALGVFQEVLLSFLLKAVLYRRRSAFEVMLGLRRWNDEGLFDENQQEWNRRAGL